MIANNCTPKQIISAVINQILISSKRLLGKVDAEKLLISGGLTQIKDIEYMASDVLGLKCYTAPNGNYLSAIGCAIVGVETTLGRLNVNLQRN